MSRFAQNRMVAVTLWIFLIPFAGTAASKSGQPQSTRPSSEGGRPVIVIGFEGGFWDAHVPHFDEAIDRIRKEYGVHTAVVFNGRGDRVKATRDIVNWLDTDGDGKLSDQEKENARIILVGHSWGCPAMLALARGLQRQHIPVTLTIVIDAVAKPWQGDRKVPANVKEAINFYEHKRLFMIGRSKIVAADPANTQILGNIRMPYNRAHFPGCTDYGWMPHLLNPYHVGIICDPQVWSRVDALVSAEASAADTESLNAN